MNSAHHNAWLAVRQASRLRRSGIVASSSSDGRVTGKGSARGISMYSEKDNVMQHWSRIILPSRQVEVMDSTTRFEWFQERAAAGNPVGFAAFRTNPPDNELYFSPEAESFGRRFGAKPCKPPRREDISLCNSDVRAWDICFPASP